MIAEDNVYIVDSMMRDVIHRGTAARTLRLTNGPLLKRQDLGGKTGTTNEAKDAGSRVITATSWRRPGLAIKNIPILGLVIMNMVVKLLCPSGELHGGCSGRQPHHGLTQPPGLVTAKIDPKLTISACGMPGAIFEIFDNDSSRKNMPTIR